MVNKIALSKEGKFLIGFSGIFVPLSSVYTVFNVSNLSNQKKEFFNLVSKSDRELSKIQQSAFLKIKELASFVSFPNSKFSAYWNELVEIHKNPKKCAVHVKLANWRNFKPLHEIKDNEEKLSAVRSIYSLGTWRLNEACMKEGLGANIWLAQKKSAISAEWKWWDLSSSTRNKPNEKHHSTWVYEKS